MQEQRKTSRWGCNFLLIGCPLLFGSLAMLFSGAWIPGLVTLVLGILAVGAGSRITLSNLDIVLERRALENEKRFAFNPAKWRRALEAKWDYKLSPGFYRPPLVATEDKKKRESTPAKKSTVPAKNPTPEAPPAAEPEPELDPEPKAKVRRAPAATSTILRGGKLRTNQRLQDKLDKRKAFRKYVRVRYRKRKPARLERNSLSDKKKSRRQKRKNVVTL